MAVRKRFSTGRQPLRISRGSTASSDSSVKAEKDLLALEAARRNAVSSTLNLELLRQRAARETSPYAKMVEDGTLKLKDLQNKAALKKAADGDLTGFIDHARQRIREGDKSYEWERLLKQATFKLEDDEWAKDIKADRATLGEFQRHLEKRLSEYPKGSAEALDTIRTITDVQRAKKAVEENARDQKAFLEYTNTNDHAAYKDYLETKLLRTVDGKMQADIVKQIGLVDDRIKKEESSKRAQELMKIQADYRTDKIGVSEAIALASKLGETPGISTGEVQHITQAINNMMTHRENEVKAAAARGRADSAASGGFEDLASFKKDLVELERAQADAREKIESGTPLTEADIQRITVASEVVKAAYETAATAPGVSAATARTYANAAATADKIPENVFRTADKATLKGIDLSPAGKEAFAKSLATMTNPAKVAESLVDRAQDLKLAYGRLITPQYQREALLGSGAALSSARSVITKAMSSPAPLTDDERVQLASLYREYQGAEEASDRTPKSFAAFVAALLGSRNDPGVMAASLQLPPEETDNFQKWFDKNLKEMSNRTVADNKGEIIGAPGAVDMFRGLEDVTRKIIANEYGARISEYMPTADLLPFMKGDNPFGKGLDPRRDEGFRAFIGQGAAGFSGGPTIQGGNKNVPSLTPPREDPNNFYPPADERPYAPATPEYDPGTYYPPIDERPQPTSAESGFMREQRHEIFGDTSPEQQAYDYLDASIPIEFDDWSLPNLPDADPVVTPESRDMWWAESESDWGSSEVFEAPTLTEFEPGGSPMEAPSTFDAYDNAVLE